MLNTSNYEYPYIIEFVDSITNIALIFFIPGLILFIGYIFYIIFSISQRDNKIINIVLVFSLLILVGSFFYYAFFILNYFELLTNALLSLFTILVYILLSPFFLIYIILTSTDIEKSLFLNSDIVFRDISLWLHLKFNMNIDKVTKESLIVLFKLLTLVLFSTKIINVTRFIISSITGSHLTKNLIIASGVFVAIFGLYIYLNINELAKLFELMLHISSSMLNGEMR